MRKYMANASVWGVIHHNQLQLIFGTLYSTSLKALLFMCTTIRLEIWQQTTHKYCDEAPVWGAEGLMYYMKCCPL